MAIDDEKKLDGEGSESEIGDSASRARNRTVMLTPEITGEVRARLAQDLGAASSDPSEASGGGIPGLRKAGQPLEGDIGGAPAGGAPASGATPGPISTASAAQPAAKGLADKPFKPVAAQPVKEVPPMMAEPVVSKRVDDFSSSPLNNPLNKEPLNQDNGPSERPKPMPVQPQGGEEIVYSKPSPIAGFFVSYDNDENGEVFELRLGRLIVTSEAPGSGNYLVLDDESVSSMHAILRISSYGEIQVLDQLSEYGTKIVRSDSGAEEELSGDKSILYHGDTIQFGDRAFICSLVQRDEKES